MDNMLNHYIVFIIHSIFFLSSRLSHSLIRGKNGVIEIQIGTAPSIARAKSGNLLVVSNKGNKTINNQQSIQ